MTRSISIRPAVNADADSVEAVTACAFEAVRRIYRPNPAAKANLSAIAPALQRLVAEEAGEVVATARFGIFDCTLRVIGLAVLPGRQRQGLARMLIEALAIIAQERGCQTLSLYTVVQTGNVPIFQQLGFRVASEKLDEFSISATGEALTEAYMERQLGR